MDDQTKCSVVRDLLPNYIENLTSEATTAFVSAHLAECEDCRAVHRAMTGQLSREEISTRAMLDHMKRRRRARRLRAWCVALALLLAAAVCLLPLPRHISVVCQAMEWRCGDETVAVPRTVSVEGYYMDYLFRQDRFDGSLQVEGYPITAQKLASARFMVEGAAPLSYYAQAGMLYHFGQLLMDPDGRSLAILVYEDSGWSGDTGLVIAGPADSRADAVGLTRRLARQYSPGLWGSNRWEN